jgi:hypothetical protein
MAADGGKAEAGGSSGPRSEPSLDELLRSLNIKGEDIGGVVVQKEAMESLKEGTKWMAVMRVLTSRPFSAISMKKTMHFAWAPAQDVTFRDVEENRFVIQANCLGDWQRITEQGPWIFREQGLLIEKFDGSCKASAVELNRIHAWVQIHDVPELYRRKQIMTELATNIGEVIMVDMKVDGGDFVRARVWLDVRKELTRFVSIKPEGQSPVIMRVKYEKVPRYCAICGLLGHAQEECGTGVHPPEMVGYGKWMLADTAWNRSQLPSNGEGQFQNKASERGFYAGGRGEGRGGRGQSTPDGGRGRGAGRQARGRGLGRGFGGRGAEQAEQSGGRAAENGVGDNRKRSSTDARLTEGSPAKGVQNLGEILMLEWKAPGSIAVSDSHSSEVNKKLDFGTGDGASRDETREGTPPPPPSAREQKRSRKHTSPKKDKNMSKKAGSNEEHRQQQ